MEKEILEQLKRIADSLEKMTPIGLGGSAFPIVRHIHVYPYRDPMLAPYKIT